MHRRWFDRWLRGDKSAGIGAPVKVFVMGGGSFLEDERFFTSLGDRFRSNYASGGKITFGGEFSLAPAFGFEGSYGYGRNNLRVTDLAAPQTLAYGVRTQRLSANLMIHSPTPVLGVRPYATAAGMFFCDSAMSAMDSSRTANRSSVVASPGSRARRCSVPSPSISRPQEILSVR